MAVMGSGMHECHLHPIFSRGGNLTRRKRLPGHFGACLANLDHAWTFQDLPTPWDLRGGQDGL